MKTRGDPVKVQDCLPTVLAQPESPISYEQAPLPPPSYIDLLILNGRCGDAVVMIK